MKELIKLTSSIKSCFQLLPFTIKCIKLKYISRINLSQYLKINYSKFQIPKYGIWNLNQ